MLPRGHKGFFKSVAILAVLFLLVGCGKDSLVNPRLDPIADFFASITSGDQPLDVTFTDRSTPGSSSITSWFWDFGDGTTSTLQNVGHLYGKAGFYTVSLRVTTDVGTNTMVKADYITVTKAGLLPPNAAFSGTPRTGGPGTPVTFTDHSSPGSAIITSWLWTFGDGGTSSTQNPTHTYTTNGSYDVTLKVTTSVASDSLTQAGYVVIAPTKPTAAFVASPTSGTAPLAVTFTDQSLTGGNPITSWAWNFGDGGTSSAQNPTHTYNAVGTYTVALTVTNAAGSDTRTRTSYIVSNPSPTPVAAFVGVPTTGVAPLTVQFTDQSVAGSTPISGRLWDFGDGSTSTAQNPSHVYTNPGTYTVVLSVTSPSGDDNEGKASYITVTAAPVAPTAEFVANTTGGFAPLTVTFTDQSTDGGSPILVWLWNFGDGATSTSQNPTHTYAAEGVYTVSLTATNAVGLNTNTKTSYITVSHVPVAPVASFTGAPTTGDAPLTVNFTDTSTPGTAPINARLWDFGDGATSLAQNPSHTYTVPGTYTVSLGVSTPDGSNSTSKGSYITVNVPPTAPTAIFSGNPTGGFAPLTVNFTDGSTNGGSPITSWSWVFGDGGTSTVQNPTHVYTAPGTYSVTLTVTNAVGSDDSTRTNYIVSSIVPVAPVADFTGTPTSGFAPLTVNFTDTSNPGTSPITGRLWDFGDGSTSTVQNPSHIYTTPGTYTVVLGVTSADGSDNETKSSYIVVSTAPTAPTAIFSGNPTTGFAPLTVTFTDGSTNGGSPITAWSWTFGDGGTSTVQNPSHVYTAPGTYSVALTVTNAVGSDDTTRTNYIVASVVPVAPVADFTGTPTTGNAPLTVNFTDTSTPGTSPITGRLWDFGDGSTSTAQNPSHIYTTPGTYTVTLGVSTADGSDTESKSSYVTVTVAPTAPTAIFTADQTSGFVPLAVTFTDQSTNGGSAITSWSWNFGDGGTSTAQNPGHTYLVPGTYTVSLTVTNAVGSDDSTRTNYITASVVPVPPNADFTGTPTTGDAPLTVNFTDASTPGTSPITGRLWDFGDGATSTAQNPSHTYTAPGTYTVSLGVTTLVGSDTETKASYIQANVPLTAPTAGFTADQTSGFVPLAVTFTDQSTNGNSTITSWSWNFGDGATSALQNPSHTYTVPGTYSVSLRVANAVGPDSTTKTNYITAAVVPVGPVADFTGTPTSGDAPLNVTFTDISTPGTSPITSWAWDFGDGGTSTAQSPSHNYTTPGSYTVTLTVTTAVSGDLEAKSNYILVSVPPTVPTANFSADQTSGFVPLAVTFTDLSSNGGSTITSWAWDFGDGGTSTAQNPSHTYTVPGVYTVSLTATNGIGSDGEVKTGYITAAVVPVAPVANFTGTPTSGDAPLTVNFTDTSTPGTSPITARLWDFGDGATSPAQNPSHTYTVPGTYSVTLSVSTAVGDDSENKGSYIQVNVPPTAPTAAFAADQTSGFVPLAVVFTDQSTNGGLPITSWAWDFGDGQSSTVQSPSHTYAVPGTYSVKLRVANAVGPDSTTKTNYITAAVVPVAPVADFSGTPLSGDAPLNVTFTDLSTPGTSPITSRLWNFGDGGTSTLANPSHNYTVPGTFTVSLGVSTNDGSDTEVKSSYVQVNVPPTAPTANFSADQTSGFVPLAVTFTDQSTDGGSAITSRLWTFGDGATSTLTNPSHTYTVPGIYDVKLRVTNAVGPDSTTKTSYITAAVVPVGPVADFTGTPTSGDAPLNVTFTDISTPGTSPITSWAWDFGDGGTSTAQSPSHNYTTPGSYTVTLTVTTAVSGDLETKSNYILVSVPPTVPTANFSADQTSGFVPLAVTFTDLSSNGGSTITSWAWDFGDGGTSTAQNPSHTYTVPGVYTVSLTATNGIGSDGEVKTGYITAAVVPVAPVANFTGTPTSGDAPLSVNFTDTSTPGTSPITSWAWNFGDGGTSTLQNPSHIYTTPGTYTVVLGVSTTVGDDVENKGSYIQVNVPPTAPTAAFAADQTSGFVPLAVTFTDQSTNGGSTITSWAWDFGDGSTSTAQSPSHSYTVPGTYSVKLRVTNAVGPDSTTKSNYITALIVPVGPTADFSGTPLVGDAPLDVAFTDLSSPGTSPITGRLWDFGDGNTSSLANPVHNYAGPGTFTVKLIVSTTVGDDTEIKTNYVQVNVAPTAPTANFTADQTSGFAPLAVTFTDQSTDGGSAITSRLWTFGDGATSTATNPSHTYTVPGIYDVKLRLTNAVGPDSTTKTSYITCQATVAPVADFSGTPLSGDAPLNVTFTDLSTPGTAAISTRSWTFGDGGTSTATNPSHNYTVPGTYSVSLTVTSAHGSDSETKTSYVQVDVPPTAPTANFTADQTSGFAPLAVNFTDTSTNGGSAITSWAWTFGDGGTSTAQSPSHNYTVPGTYNVKLRVANAVGPDSTTKSSYITVNATVAPVADFSGTPLSGDAPLSVTFTDLSTAGTAPISTHDWSFGDGGTSTASNPSHNYTVPGTYTVSLTVTSAHGTDSETKTSYVQVDVPPTAPAANFTADQTSGFAPLAVNFTDASTNGGSAITSWLWTFGDGGTSTAPNPSHSYTVPGTYNVKLRVANAVGPDSTTKNSFITANATVAPVAEFSGTPLFGDAPLNVTFTDLSTPGTAAIATHSWTFGDGGTSTAANPSHNYTVPGTYSVSLTVTSAHGSDSETKTSYVLVNVPATAPTANFIADQTSGFAPLSVQFTDLSSDNGATITAWAWDFGDGESSTSQNPSHSYTAPGTYDVKLRVTNAVGPDSTTKSSYITANATVAPVADFSGTPLSGDAPLNVTFTDLSTPGTAAISSHSWTFGDGGTSTAANPSHNYTVPGTYSVSLTVTSAHGSDSETKTSYVQVDVPPTAPTANFTGSPTSGFAPLSVNFADTSTNGGSTITSWLWTFGDGATSTAQNPSHNYTVPGAYDVKLRVANAVGPDSTTKSSYITASATVGPTAEFSGTPLSGDAPLSVTFTDLSTAGTAAISSWAWTFGDGGTSTAANPSHNYTVPGTYTVSLSVTTAHGSDGETKTNYVTAQSPTVPPTAAFSGTPTTGGIPLNVQFTDASTAGTSPITSYLWDFGDSTTSTEQSPSHNYTAVGVYTVSLKVTTADGQNTDVKSNYITAADLPNVNFGASRVSGFAPMQVDFEDQTAPNGATLTSWSWDFGDSAHSTSQNPSHTYTVPGTYTVSLSATNSVGTGFRSKPDFITVGPEPIPPTANFTGTPLVGVAPLNVQFTDASTAGSAPIDSRLWDFGDESTSTEVSPNHTYTTPGIYTVVLSVHAEDGGEDVEDKGTYITVLSTPIAPTADFGADQTAGFVPLAVNFTDVSSNGGSTITSWDWTFGDGATSTSQNPSHTYTVPGIYDVKLRVTNSVGPDSTTKSSYITASVVPVPPTADFSGTPTSGPASLNVTFTDLSTAGTSPIISRLWDFGDGSTSTAASPTHMYTTPGIYTVVLSVHAADANEDHEDKATYISVCQAPTAAMSGTPTSGQAPLDVQFTDASSPSITGWLWDFGDGNTSTETNPLHTYQVAGTYPVKLKVTNACSADSLLSLNYVTVTDTCPNPTYTIAGARWDTATDDDHDGYQSRARLVWNADLNGDCSKSVFARVYYHDLADTVWTLAGESPCYTITSNNSGDTRAMFIENLPQACYNFKIELYECGSTTLQATLLPVDDSDLSSQCFEPAGADASGSASLSGTSP